MSPVITYLDGWYDEEHDGTRPFRWMGASARCRLDAGGLDRPAWLRVAAGHSSPVASPVLTVSLNGHPAGRHTILPDLSHYLFPIDAGAAIPAELDVEFALDRTFQVDGDSRRLGIVVRAIDLVVLEEADADGWYQWEREEYFPFRWMGTRATLTVPRVAGRFLSLPVATDMADGEHVLCVQSSRGDVVNVALLQGWHLYDITVREAGVSALQDADGAIDFTLILNGLAPPTTHPADPRSLGVRVGLPEVHDDGRRHQYADRFYKDALAGLTGNGPEGSAPGRRRCTGDRGFLPQDADGWHSWEFHDIVPFRWMKREARVNIPASVHAGRPLCMVPVLSEYGDGSQMLTIAACGEVLVELPLAPSWEYHTLPVPASSGDLILTFRLNKLVPAEQHPGDGRELGARVGPLRFVEHSDERSARFERENAARNRREMEAGATVLSSFPVSLGIDLFARCNINPPCVYCLWDRMKETEGEAAALTVDDRTLEEYAEFFAAARSLTNCSFGEPLLHPRLAQILDLLESCHKTLELSTNGQAFTPASVGALAGRPMVLYVSLDSASAATYARLRNERWHDVITGLTYLRDARRRANGLPKVNLVFMPMRANREDLEAYFRLCRMVEADTLVLRPLLRLEHSGIVVDRGGYHYDYDREHLAESELEEVFRASRAFSRQYGVRVTSQFDFGIRS